MAMMIKKMQWAVRGFATIALLAGCGGDSDESNPPGHDQISATPAAV